METYTTTAAGRTVELEIVENAPRGYAVNFHQLRECVGLINFHKGGFEAETSYTDSGEWTTLGVFRDRFAALGAIVDHLGQRLERLEYADDLPASQDPADAAPLVLDELDPEVYGGAYSPAAIRDICRRAAYDMGITDRRAHSEMLPAIAHRAADMIRTEYAPTLRQFFKSDLAEILASSGWTAEHRRTSYTSPIGSFAITITAETITVHLEAPASETVEILNLDRASTSAERLARIIEAATE